MSDSTERLHPEGAPGIADQFTAFGNQFGRAFYGDTAWEAMQGQAAEREQAVRLLNAMLIAEHGAKVAFWRSLSLVVFVVGMAAAFCLVFVTVA